MHNRRLFLLILIAVILLFAAGCEKDGKIKIINRTSYPVYAGVKGDFYTISSHSNVEINISTGTQGPFDSNVGKYVDVTLAGETFQIWDAYLDNYVNGTYVWVNAGETTKIYADPNRACVKIVNNTNRYIKRIIVQRNTLNTTVTDYYEVFLGPGEFWFKQQNPSSPSNLIYYIAQVVFENDEIYSYGDNENYLFIDDEFLVNVEENE